MTRYEYATLDENNNVVPTDENFLRGHNWRRRVAEDTINGIRISTVFIGHNMGYDGIDLWFETMIFTTDAKDVSLSKRLEIKTLEDNDNYAERWETWEDAKEGHERFRKWVIEGLPYGKSPDDYWVEPEAPLKNDEWFGVMYLLGQVQSALLDDVEFMDHLWASRLDITADVVDMIELRKELINSINKIFQERRDK